MTTQNIMQMVREGLAACQPCRARMIVSYLRDHCDMHVDLRSVNQVLYGALRAEVGQNANYEWSIKNTAISDEQCEVALPTGSSDALGMPKTGESATFEERRACEDRAKLLRTLQRLRSGLPPTEGIEHLSVGYSRVIADIQQRLNGHGGSGRWIMARGNYGAGKTHFLETVRSIAHSRNFATCYLCADSGMNALNHPQRFVSNLLGTLEVPGRASVGYEPIILEMAETPEGRTTLLDLCRKWSIGGRMPFSQAAWRLWTLESINAAGASGDARHAPWIASLLADDLCGLTITHRCSSPDVRQAAYHLLLMARDLIVLSGHRGIVVLLDEAESIYTKLPNFRSRTGAMKVLAALCESQSFDKIVTALAITPDAHGMLLREMGGTRFDDCLERFEPVDKLLRHCADESSYVVDCRTIRGGDVPMLLERLRRFYLSAYTGWSPTPLQETDWTGFVTRTRTLDLPNRLLVRHAVDLLDAQRHGMA